MPQLNPAPWLIILVFTWLIFLTIVTAKVATRVHPKELNPQYAKSLKATPWDWPWH